MTSGQRVLVVDGLSETEQVLRAVLEPRGLTVDRIRSGRGELPAPAEPPSVVVLHLEEATAELPPVAASDDVPRVIIGTAEFAAAPSPGDAYLQKPFQYRELIRAIERLMETPAA